MMNCPKFARYLIVSVLLLLASAPLYAQTERARLVVRVVDMDDKPVPDATVTLVETQTQQARTATTNQQGLAIFNEIAPGTYEVKASTLDFGETPLKKISLQVGATLQVELPLGFLAPPPVETVTVKSAAVAPHPVSSAEQNELLILPNLNNDLTPLLQSVPGAIPAGSANLGRVIIDGKGAEQQATRLDGLDATALIELPGGDSALALIESFQNQSVAALDQSNSSVISKAFSPIYGPGTGSITESVTKRGGTGYQFTFYNLTRNDSLDARNYFDYDGKNGIRRHQFGGKFGGPLPGKSAFFFLGYEGIRGRTERNLYEAVPASAISPSPVGLMSSLLGGSLPAGTSRTEASLDKDFIVATRRARTISEGNAFDARFDFLRPTNLEDGLLIRITRQTGHTSVPDGITGRRQLQRVTFMNALAKGRWTIAEQAIHELKVGLNLSRGEMDVEAGSTALGTSLVTVDTPVNTTGLPPGFGSVPVATFGGQVKGLGNGFLLDPYAIIAAYNLTYITKEKAHTFNFGGETRFLRLEFDRRGGITYAFPNMAALNSATPNKVTFVSDLSGPGPFGATGSGPRHAAQEYFTGYFQDQWTMKAPGTIGAAQKTLILTYGVRFDYFGVVRATDGRAVIFDPETIQILPGGTPFYQTRKNNFQPRVGVAYELPPEHGLFANSTLRASFGLYSGIPRIGDLLLPIESDRFNYATRTATFPLTASQLAAEFLANPETRQFQPLTFSRDFITPERAYKWEIALERKVPKFGSLTLSYFGNAGRDLPLAGIGNPIIGVETNVDPTKDAEVVRQFDIVRNDLVSHPFGEFSFRTSGGRSTYNAFSVVLARNTQSGWPKFRWLRFASFKTQYTFSRNLGNASGGVASNPSNFDSDYGYNAADARHVFSLTAAYKLWTALSADPAEPNYKQWDLLRGWSVGTKISARSGLPLIIRLDRPDVVYLDASGNVFSTPAVGRHAVINTPGGDATGNARVPSLIAGINPYLRDGGLRILNPEAFTIPAPGEFGNIRRGDLRGPNLFQLDLSFTRYVINQERSKGFTLDFKVEFFNVLNHANFANPTAALPDRLGTDLSANQIQPGMPFTTVGAKSFGVINAADAGRRIQFSLNFKLNDGF
jgi:carboxypeptidase family protein